MKVNLAGRIRNTQLSSSKALLPMFEAVVNSIQAIEEVVSRQEIQTIDIIITRDSDLPNIDGLVNGFIITDNGIGFTEANFESFFTSDTQYKSSKGGKGIGRFMWLKAFENATIESHYRENGQMLMRKFKFTPATDQLAGPSSASTEKMPRTTVGLINLLPIYKDNCPQLINTIGSRLVEHCLPFFMDSKCPHITIRDKKDSIDLNKYFQDNFASTASHHNFKIADYIFTLKGLRLYNPHEKDHRFIYAANSREVLSEKLKWYLPNLQKKLSDEKGTFVYLGFIESKYLDEHVNSERTNFLFPRDISDQENIFGEITLKAIREAALEYVSVDLKSFLVEINMEKLETIRQYIANEAPQYKALLRDVSKFIDTIPPGERGFELEAHLHEHMFLKQKALKKESKKLMEESSTELLKPEYEEKFKKYLEEENEIGKSALAQYVVHRKIILEFLERSLQVNPETGKYSLEKIIHNIIFPMNATSEDVPYEQQNLWIVDERLSYHWFLASDIPLKSAEPLINESESRPDLMIFERALTFAEDEGALNSLVIIEFKKPLRDSYDKEDPVDQVYRLIREIKKGHFKDKKGREIKVQTDRIPVYAYVICDTTKQIETIAENKSMFKTPDNLGYYVYNQTLSTYVEIISYSKLLKDAKKRNKILFEKLNLPST